jgi:hypothetical protein
MEKKHVIWDYNHKNAILIFLNESLVVTYQTDGQTKRRLKGSGEKIK